MAQWSRPVGAPQQRQKWFQQVAFLGREARLHQQANALTPFSGLEGFGAREVIAADAGMGIKQAERLVLGGHVVEHARKHRMFQRVTMIAGVKGVAVVHRGFKAGP